MTSPTISTKHNLIRGHLTIHSNYQKVLEYTKVKRIYFRTLKYSGYIGNRMHLKYYKGKQSSYLRTLHVGHKETFPFIDLVKNCKKLKHVQISYPPQRDSLELVNSCIKRLPKQIEIFEIRAGKLDINAVEIQDFYRSLARCRNLKKLSKNIPYPNKVLEHNFINRYVPQLKNLQRFSCGYETDTNEGLDVFMGKGHACFCVTGIIIDILEPDDINEEARMNQIAPFFNFDTFPCLKELKLYFYGLVPLGAYVMEDFKALNNLEYFSLYFDGSPNSEFFFKALFHLPLLLDFDFCIDLITNEEECLLAEFLQKQTRLRSLSLWFDAEKRNFDVHNQNLEKICCDLNNKPSLRSLALNSSTWSLNSLSEGLRRTKLTNQLQKLQIYVCDDSRNCSLSPLERVGGLCNFIIRQKGSLKHLDMSIELIQEDCIMDSLIGAFSELEKLVSLKIHFNQEVRKFFEFFQKTLQEMIQEKTLNECPPFERTFVHLTRALTKLMKLSKLRIYMSGLLGPDKIATTNCSVVFNAFPAMKNLRKLWLSLPSLKEALKKHPAQAMILLELKKASSIEIDSVLQGLPDQITESVEEIENVLQLTKEKRHLRAMLS